MKVICKYNDPFTLPSAFPNDFDYGLVLEKEYAVMGIVQYMDEDTLYFLIDENGRPGWYPQQLFFISNNSLSCDWFVSIPNRPHNSDIRALWGFSELCKEDSFFDALTDRDENALSIYYKRKHEADNFNFRR